LINRLISALSRNAHEAFDVRGSPFTGIEAQGPKHVVELTKQPLRHKNELRCPDCADERRTPNAERRTLNAERRRSVSLCFFKTEQSGTLRLPLGACHEVTPQDQPKKRRRFDPAKHGEWQRRQGTGKTVRWVNEFLVSERFQD